MNLHLADRYLGTPTYGQKMDCWLEQLKADGATVVCLLRANKLSDRSSMSTKISDPGTERDQTISLCLIDGVS